MLLFQHLLLGLSIGCLIALFVKSTNPILYTGFGAILPDLIDKPVAVFIFENSIYWGRSYSHTLIFCIIIIAIGVMYLIKNHDKIGLLCIGIGCLSHQITDSLKLNTWFYPFIENSYMPNINPIIFCIIIAVCVFTIYYIWDKHKTWFIPIGVIGAGILIMNMNLLVNAWNYLSRILTNNACMPYEIICVPICILLVLITCILKYKSISFKKKFL
jgi:hypothetical protein